MEKEKGLFARLNEDKSRSGMSRLDEAITHRQFDHPDEPYRVSMLHCMRIMPEAAADYLDRQ